MGQQVSSSSDERVLFSNRNGSPDFAIDISDNNSEQPLSTHNSFCAETDHGEYASLLTFPSSSPSSSLSPSPSSSSSSSSSTSTYTSTYTCTSPSPSPLERDIQKFLFQRNVWDKVKHVPGFVQFVVDLCETVVDGHFAFEKRRILKHFLTEMVSLSNVNGFVYLVTVVLLDRMLVKSKGDLNGNGGLKLTNRKVLPAFLVSLMVSCKFVEDFTYSNAQFATMGRTGMGLEGFDINLLNRLELEMLTILHYEAFVDVQEIVHFVKNQSQKSPILLESPFLASISNQIGRNQYLVI